jgi:hypothetical protein
MTTATEVLGGVFDADMYRPSFEAGISLNPDTKENESSWIFEPCLTCSNAVRRVQHPGFSLVTAASTVHCDLRRRRLARRLAADPW